MNDDRTAMVLGGGGQGDEAIPLVPWRGLEMVVSPTEALRRVQELRAFVRSVMVKDEDFGVIPGTKKPTLYQPGAQKLGELYAFAHRFEVVEKIERWEEPMLFVYVMRCIITSRHDGRFIAEGLGSCNSKEDKYAWRWAYERDVPSSIDKATLKRRSGDDWVQYRLPNDDIASVANTILKMGCKRAYVHGIISATRSAGIFTQDKESLPPEVFGEELPTRSWESAVDDPDVQPDMKAATAAKAAEAKRKKRGEPAEDPEVTAWVTKLAAIGESGTGADLKAMRDALAKLYPEDHPHYKTIAHAFKAAKDAGTARAQAAADAEATAASTATTATKGSEAAAGASPADAGTTTATTEKAEPAAEPAKKMREAGED